MNQAVKCVETIIEYEGLTFEEAVLSYKARQKLPKSAFCGPDRSYPCHDAAHVRSAFQRLSQLGRKMSPALRKRIHACIMRKAKQFGVEHKGCWICKGKKFKETISQLIAWFTETVEFQEAKKLWIAGAIKKKGALRSQLGVKEGKTIPKSLLRRIVGAKTGTKISYGGKTFTVTTQLKRRALLALRLGKMKKGGK